MNLDQASPRKVCHLLLSVAASRSLSSSEYWFFSTSINQSLHRLIIAAERPFGRLAKTFCQIANSSRISGYKWVGSVGASAISPSSKRSQLAKSDGQIGR